METHEIIEALAATPGWLKSALASLPDDAAWHSPVPDAWSPAEILAHLRASNAILAPRVYQLLVRPNAPLAGFDERAWAEICARARLPLGMQLTAFEAHRTELVGVLRTLTEVEWEIVGQHETRGALTLRMICEDLAGHEREHRSQLEALIAAMGPRRRSAAARQSRPRGSGKSHQRAEALY